MQLRPSQSLLDLDKHQKILDSILIPSAEGEAKVFYYKMKADYQRYLAEFSTGEKQKAAAQTAREAYESAQSISEPELAPTHKI